MRSTGTLWCWGLGTSSSGSGGSYGQAIAPAGTFSQVSAGGYHACGVHLDGFAECWGCDRYHQTEVPAAVPP